MSELKEGREEMNTGLLKWSRDLDLLKESVRHLNNSHEKFAAKLKSQKLACEQSLVKES